MAGAAAAVVESLVVLVPLVIIFEEFSCRFFPKLTLLIPPEALTEYNKIRAYLHARLYNLFTVFLHFQSCHNGINLVYTVHVQCT